ncbi:MAG: recombinase RecQ [Frankiales bacterium]|nr:recombinase RecQ [Frankiales bacterium]
MISSVGPVEQSADQTVARAAPDAGPDPAVRAEAERHLRALAGPNAELRADQWVAIEALTVQRRRALVVQRTGWGKSAVYFVATALLRAQGAGPTVIISPLLALMRNQIAAAERAGIRAATINSTNLEGWQETYAAINRGEIDVLLLSPERLNNPDFRDNVMGRLAASCGLLVVDEAHCISDWGHDFRPDFRRLRTLLPELPAGIPVLATTATANSRVVEDIADVLGLHAGAPNGPGEVLVLRGPLDRASLHLSVIKLASTAHRLAWLADHLAEFPGSGIIYTLTVAASQEVADYLRERGVPVAAYSGKTEQTERLAAEDDLLNNRVKALVATSALGMGFDKPDLGFVIHFGAPASPIAYYQQVGRAGRGVDRAQVILLPGSEDQAVWDYFASVGFPRESQVRTTLQVLAGRDGAVSTAALETEVDLSRTRLETMLKVLDVDGAVHRVRGGWTATGQPWSYDAERYSKVAATRTAEQAAMRAYLSTDGCRMRFLREQLDDPDAVDCGRCDNCGGVSISSSTAAASLNDAEQSLGRPGVVLEPRKQWPTAMTSLGVPVKGKISESELAQPGRAIARFTDLSYGRQLRQLLLAPTPDGLSEADRAAEHVPSAPLDAPHPAPTELISAELISAAVKVLASWEWAQRPAAVVYVGSRSRPALIAEFARRISELGRLPALGALHHRPGSPAARSNSAQRLHAVWSAYELPADLAAHLAGEFRGQPVLLIDDYADTGWTLAVVSRLLRQAGAGEIYPFVLATAGAG